MGADRYAQLRIIALNTLTSNPIGYKLPRMEKNLIPVESKDLERQGIIAVQRSRVMGANYLGCPSVEGVDEQYFTNLASALEWSAESPEYSHHFTIPLPELELSAELRGPRRVKDGEMLTVRHNGKIAESPRSVEGHHAVSTDYEDLLDLIIHLEPNQGSLFDRGVVWVDLSDNNSPHTLKFHINAGVHTSGEIEVGILQMLVRVNHVLDDLAKGS